MGVRINLSLGNRNRWRRWQEWIRLDRERKRSLGRLRRDDDVGIVGDDGDNSPWCYPVRDTSGPEPAAPCRITAWYHCRRSCCCCCCCCFICMAEFRLLRCARPIRFSNSSRLTFSAKRHKGIKSRSQWESGRVIRIIEYNRREGERQYVGNVEANPIARYLSIGPNREIEILLIVIRRPDGSFSEFRVQFEKFKYYLFYQFIFIYYK